MDNFIKIRISLGLCVVLGVSLISVRASDSPAQAAARAALKQKLNQPDAWEPQPLTTTTTPSVAAVEPPGTATAIVTGRVPETAVTPQAAPVTTTPVAAPVAETPAVVAPVAVVPAAVAPAAVAPAAAAPAVVTPVAVAPAEAPVMSFPMLSFLLLSLLLLSLLIVSLLLLKLRQVKLLLLKHPTVAPRAVAASSEDSTSSGNAQAHPKRKPVSPGQPRDRG